MNHYETTKSIISADSRGDAHRQVPLVNRIAEIARGGLNRHLDITGINCNRFITHLRDFAERVIAGKIVGKSREDFSHDMLRFHPQRWP